MVAAMFRVFRRPLMVLNTTGAVALDEDHRRLRAPVGVQSLARRRVAHRALRGRIH